MKALSIRQPWAWLICAGYKDIENRDWPTAFTGRIYVHAGKQSDLTEETLDFVRPAVHAMGKAFPPGACWKDVLTFGAIIGEVDITGCVGHSDSPWFVGPYGFVLRNPTLYPKPIPCGGRLGFFEPDMKPVLKDASEVTGIYEVREGIDPVKYVHGLR